jgi:outer membrane immunogenic protein
MRKAIAVGIASFFSMNLSVHAADLDGSVKDAPVAYGPAHSWAGLYVGASAGFAKGELTDTRIVDQFLYPFSYHAEREASDDLSGALYGAHIGYNWQFGHLVAGLEASINGADIDGSVAFGQHTVKTELNWYASAVARLGYAEGSWLFYGFGGVAWAQGSVDPTAGLPNGTYIDGSKLNPTTTVVAMNSSDSDHIGWTAGFGVEYALSDRFSVRAEYSHVDLGDDTVASGNITATNGGMYNSITYHDKADLDFDAIKVGASYKLFGPERGLETLK